MPRKPKLAQAPQGATAPKAPDEALDAAATVLRPLIRLLLHSGIDYTRLAADLKQLFVEQAVAEIEQAGQATTDSAISLMSGVHRKDVRHWRETGRPGGNSKGVALAAQVFAQWASNPAYRTRNGRLARLPRSGGEPSFETLVRTVTNDVHPFTVLQELVRLGIAEVRSRGASEYVVPLRAGFVPDAGSREALELLAANVGDHALAAVSNVLGGPPTLEQSVFAAGITEDSARQLGEVARRLWSRARTELIAEATRLYEADKLREDARTRVRFGSYFWSGPWQPARRNRKENQS